MVGKVTSPTQLSSSRIVPFILEEMGMLYQFSTRNDELQKTINAIKGFDTSIDETEPMRFGNLLEPIILHECFRKLRCDNFSTQINDPYQHNDLPLACSLDGYILGQGQIIETNIDEGIYVMNDQQKIILTGNSFIPVEAKSTAHFFSDNPPLDRGIVQLQSSMLITGGEIGILTVLHQGYKHCVYIFEKNLQMQDMIEDCVRDFERRIDIYKKTKKIEWYELATSSDGNTAYPEANEETIDLDDDVDQMCSIILELKNRKKDIDSKIDDMEKKIKEKMKESSKAQTDNHWINWSMRNYKATPERVVPAKDARTVRSTTLTIKEKDNG